MAPAGYNPLYVNKRISGWVKFPKSPEAVVYFFHGNGENAADWRTGLDFVLDEYRSALVLIEYRGYAKVHEPLATCENELVSDAVAVIEQLKKARRFRDLPEVLWGRSLGGAIAAATALATDVDGLILESTFSSFGVLAKETVRVIPSFIMNRLVCNFKFNTAETINHIKCPVLIAHSIDDELIPVSHAEVNFRKANRPKQFVRVTGGHNDLKHDQAVFRSAMDDFALSVRQHAMTYR